jgi:hypothetical protein
MRRAPERSGLIGASEKRWLTKLVWWAYVLRAGVALALHYWGVSSRLAPDEETYFQMGRGLAYYWTGEVFTQPQRLTFDDPFAYFYLNVFHLPSPAACRSSSSTPSWARWFRYAFKLAGRRWAVAHRWTALVRSSSVLSGLPEHPRRGSSLARLPVPEELPAGRGYHAGAASAAAACS